MPEHSQAAPEKSTEAQIPSHEYQEHQHLVEIPQDISKKLLATDWDAVKGNQQNEYRKFQTYLTQNQPQSETILMVIRSVEVEDLSNFIFENGFIINADTRNLFLAQFGKTEADKSDSRTSVIETKTETANEELKNEEQIRQQYQEHLAMFQ